MKKSFFSLLHKFRITRLAAWWNRKRVIILCYHGVTERRQRHPADRAGLHIRADRFEAQLNYLRRHYRIISLAKFLEARKNNVQLPDYSVVLTFDDGYRNFLTGALPRLNARNLPVSVFLITERIQMDSPSRVNGWSEADDETFLSWAEIRELQRYGVEFGSHTCSHRKLSEIVEVEAERELRESHKIIAAHLSQATMPFAFPYGAYSEPVIAMTRELPYTCALTTDAGTNAPQTDLFLLRRNLIGDDDDEALFAARVSGLTALFQKAIKRHQKH
ncbi:MAG TPA: polysaccharide deacetylase family protein [Pyrinomonadaceae bacterium]|nr:polysaccharide deacetylase family protein [Pyrinomonadaceae bacterium]